MNILGWDLGPNGICAEIEGEEEPTTTTTTLWLFNILLHIANLLHIQEATEILQYKENVEVVLLCSQECQFKGLDHRYCNLV
jgi:hypothetical protein